MIAQTRASIDRSRKLLLATKLPGAKRGTVSIKKAGDEWHVLIEETGLRDRVRSFDVEAHALSYAEEQKARLRLNEVRRI